MTLLPRATSNASQVIQNITIDRFRNFTEQWGGYANDTVDVPNWGNIMLSTVSVYPDFLGDTAWLLLFIIPFLMMWVAFSDILPVAIVGIFFGLYVFGFLGGSVSQWIGIVLIGASVTLTIVGLWKK